MRNRNLIAILKFEKVTAVCEHHMCDVSVSYVSLLIMRNYDRKVLPSEKINLKNQNFSNLCLINVSSSCVNWELEII
jgi:hypothetical protein